MRKNISTSDLCNVIELLYRIAYLKKDRELQVPATVQTADETSLQAEAKDAETIYQKRMAAELQSPPLPKKVGLSAR